MPAELLRVDPLAPDASIMRRAADILRAGGLVAFPTETVYGLGANALDPAAVARIFAAKGRPADNPLIVHVAQFEDALALAESWPEVAERLATRFWPGPLTLVVPAKPIVPEIVTAGGPTVGLRIPSHPVALALLRCVGVPLAAPSANRSTQLSPTRAEHVAAGLSDRIDLILDAGPTIGGIESTVLDVTCDPPRLLRPGLITVAQLRDCVGTIDLRPPESASPARSPGMMARHYAPRTPMTLVAAPGQDAVLKLLAAGQRVAWLTYFLGDLPETPNLRILKLPADPLRYAAGLYESLHLLDAAKFDRIVVDMPPADETWLAVHDRLRRAAT